MALQDPPDEALEMITEALWAGAAEGETVYGVHFDVIEKHDAINLTASGHLEIGPHEYGFTVDVGNNGGDVVRQWCLLEDYIPYEMERPEMYRVVPLDRSPDFAKDAIIRNSLRGEYADLESSYNYDRYFQPGVKIESYYTERLPPGTRWAKMSSLSRDMRGRFDFWRERGGY